METSETPDAFDAQLRAAAHDVSADMTQLDFPPELDRRFELTRSLLAEHPIPVAPGAYLLVVEKGGEAEWFQLAAETIMGRDAQATLTVDSQAISRRHMVFRRDDNDWLVEDLSSTNGMFINGSKQQRHCLRKGDLIQVSEFLFIFVTVDE